VIGHAAGE